MLFVYIFLVLAAWYCVLVLTEKTERSYKQKKRREIKINQYISQKRVPFYKKRNIYFYLKKLFLI